MASEVGQLLNDLANILAQDSAYALDGTFLYVEAGPGWVDVSIFKSFGDDVVYRPYMAALGNFLHELWEAATPDKRWTTLQYQIDGNRFTASFTYEPLDPEESTDERREHILHQRFGDKRVVYPPLF